MEAICSILNLAIVAATFLLMAHMFVTGNAPGIAGCVWIALVGFRSLAEVFRK